MKTMMPVHGGPVDREDYRKTLLAEIEVTERLTKTLCEWLLLSARAQLAALDIPDPKPTAEDLMRAVEQRDRIQEALNRVDGQLAGIPEEIRGFIGSAGELLRSPLLEQLRQAEDWISELQKLMEA